MGHAPNHEVARLRQFPSHHRRCLGESTTTTPPTTIVIAHRALQGYWRCFQVSFAVIASAGITAAVQAVAAMVGFLIARVPSPFFFALVTFFLALVPVIGAAVVCLFAALLLLVTGHPYMAAFLVIWGLVVVGLADNLVKPLLIRRGLDIAVLRMYHRDYSPGDPLVPAVPGLRAGSGAPSIAENP
jgi:AI-2E family transporter